MILVTGLHVLFDVQADIVIFVNELVLGFKRPITCTGSPLDKP